MESLRRPYRADPKRGLHLALGLGFLRRRAAISASRNRPSRRNRQKLDNRGCARGYRLPQLQPLPFQASHCRYVRGRVQVPGRYHNGPYRAHATRAPRRGRGRLPMRILTLALRPIHRRASRIHGLSGRAAASRLPSPHRNGRRRSQPRTLPPSRCAFHRPAQPDAQRTDARTYLEFYADIRSADRGGAAVRPATP